MLNFLRKGEHQYHFGFHNVIQGIDIGLSRPEVRAMIEELFPDYKTLTEEFHVNLAIIKHEDVNENELAVYKYHNYPILHLCYHCVYECDYNFERIYEILFDIPI